MESILFGLCLIAVVLLIVWVERDPTRPSKQWWPFDMPGFVPPKDVPAPHSWRNLSRQRDGR